MSASLARLDARMPQTSPFEDRRRERRHLTRAEASLRSSRGDLVAVSIVDVSSHGCAIQLDAECVRTGSFVAIGLGEHPTLSAIVRWVREGTAGMEFLGPIPAERGEWHDLMDEPFA